MLWYVSRFCLYICTKAVCSYNKISQFSIHTMLENSVGSRPGIWVGSRIGGRQKGQKGIHLFKYQRLSAIIVGCHTNVVTFCRPKSGYFCWSNYAIFQGITTVWKRLISLIQKKFETGPKQWASFFTSYTYLAYLQNVFEGIEACCDIRSEISEEQCLKRIPGLVRCRTVYLRLGSDNSCPTIGLK